MTLRHCAGRASADRLGRHPAARAGVGELLDLLRGCGLRLERPERRVALHVPLHDAGLEDLPGRKRRAADHARDVARDDLLVADAVLHGRDGAVRERVRGGRDRALRVHRLRRDDAEVARRKRRGVRGRREPADDVARPGEPQPVRVDRVDVRLRDVVRPDLDVVELREVRREQRPDCSAADDADPHRRLRAVRASRGSENSRPPVSPLGRTMRTSAMTALTTTMRDPAGQVDRAPENGHPVLHLREHASRGR